LTNREIGGELVAPPLWTLFNAAPEDHQAAFVAMLAEPCVHPFACRI
jgi:hypothetical protein